MGSEIKISFNSTIQSKNDGSGVAMSYRHCHKWCGHVMRMKEKHIVEIMLDADIPWKRRRKADKSKVW